MEVIIKFSHTILITLLVTAFTLLFWLVIFQFVSAPKFLDVAGLTDAYSIIEPKKLNNPHALKHIGELTRDGMIMTIDDLWSFQGSFYQTIITALIGINALIGALAFFAIRNTSREHAEQQAQEAAKAKVLTYTSSIEFSELIERNLAPTIKEVQDDLEEVYEIREQLLENEDKQNADIEILNSELNDLKRQIRIISSKVANMQSSETFNGMLSKGNGE